MTRNPNIDAFVTLMGQDCSTNDLDGRRDVFNSKPENILENITNRPINFQFQFNFRFLFNNVITL